MTMMIMIAPVQVPVPVPVSVPVSVAVSVSVYVSVAAAVSVSVSVAAGIVEYYVVIKLWCWGEGVGGAYLHEYLHTCLARLEPINKLKLKLAKPSLKLT